MLVYALNYLLLVNNVYFRHHRTLKDVGLNSRLSLGTLIGKILKVNRVHIRKSKHADFDQQLKVHTRVPDVLQSFAHTVSVHSASHDGTARKKASTPVSRCLRFGATYIVLRDGYQGGD